MALMAVMVNKKIHHTAKNYKYLTYFVLSSEFTSTFFVIRYKCYAFASSHSIDSGGSDGEFFACDLCKLPRGGCCKNSVLVSLLILCVAQDRKESSLTSSRRT